MAATIAWRCRRNSVGIYAVEVLAIDDDAKRFYVKYGFVPLADGHLHLYLPRRMIEDESADNARDE
jgi:hypothetical protein